MKTKFKSYKLPVDHLEQAAREVAACSLSVVQKRDELTAAQGLQSEAERRLLALLEQKKRKSVVVDKVKYILLPDGSLGKELIL